MIESIALGWNLMEGRWHAAKHLETCVTVVQLCEKCFEIKHKKSLNGTLTFLSVKRMFLNILDIDIESNNS